MKFDKATERAFALKANVENENGDLLAAIRSAAIKAAADKGNAETAKATDTASKAAIWPLVRQLARDTHEHEGAEEMAPDAVQGVMTALVLDALENEPAAIATVKAYTSTARKCIAAVAEGKVSGWAVLCSAINPETDASEDVSHEQVRDLLKSDEAKEIAELVASIGKMVRKIGGRENSKARSHKDRMGELQAIADSIEPAYSRAIRADDAAKESSKAAAAAADVKQQAPSAPMQTEVSQRPQAAAA